MIRFPFFVCALGLFAGAATAQSLSPLDEACRAEGHARWLEPRAPVHNILLMGDIRPPGDSNEELQPKGGFGFIGGDAEQWMSWTGVSEVDMYMKPGAEPYSPHLFGPRRGAPEGVYRIRRLPAGDPACSEYDTAQRAYAALFHRPFQTQASCLAYKYIGTTPAADYTYTYVTYVEPTANGRAFRQVFELRNAAGRPAARTIHFQLFGDAPKEPACFRRSGVLAELFAALRSQ